MAWLQTHLEEKDSKLLLYLPDAALSKPRLRNIFLRTNAGTVVVLSVFINSVLNSQELHLQDTRGIQNNVAKNPERYWIGNISANKNI